MKPLPRQIQVCADRLPEPQRTYFLDSMRTASVLHAQVVALRVAAWAEYRRATGQERAEPKR
jgi:hypothetical protein